MKHIHPFPARMAPEIALSKVAMLKGNQKVLDPMTGSGMVLSTAARSGIESIGVDLDPLAVLISGVASTRVDVSDIYRALEILERKALEISDSEITLSWIDMDPETQSFINFWFFETNCGRPRYPECLDRCGESVDHHKRTQGLASA
jgi:hypothetical protein